MLGALAANPSSKVAGIVAIGVGHAASSNNKVASLLYRFDSNRGRVTSAFSVSGNGWLYDWAFPGKILLFVDREERLAYGLDWGVEFYLAVSRLNQPPIAH